MFGIWGWGEGGCGGGVVVDATTGWFSFEIISWKFSNNFFMDLSMISSCFSVLIGVDGGIGLEEEGSDFVETDCDFGAGLFFGLSDTTFSTTEPKGSNKQYT